MVCSKIRLRFRKDGDLRLISHHDLLRTFERMLRRADVPFRSSEGFNPKARLVFALSLALGIIGHEEVVEIELCEEVPADAIRERLMRHAPPGLTLTSARLIDHSLTAHVSQVTYRLFLPEARLANTRIAVERMLAADQLWIERTRPRPRRLDIRSYVKDCRIVNGALEMDLAVTSAGTARPEEVLHFLELEDCLEQGAVLERIRLLLVDETTTHSGHDGPIHQSPGLPEAAALGAGFTQDA
jgi:radical SAM-linked protein